LVLRVSTLAAVPSASVLQEVPDRDVVQARIDRRMVGWQQIVEQAERPVVHRQPALLQQG
jgi:hypothetical protein